MQELVVGDPVSGLIEATSGDNSTAQLTGWPPISADEWKLHQPRSFHDDGLELIGDDLATLPAISSENCGRAHPPNVGYARLHGRKVPKHFDQPPAEKNGRGRYPEPRNSPERRLLERFYKKNAEKRPAALAGAAARHRTPLFKAPPTLSFHTVKSGFLAFRR